jgi:hypothetical protein
VSGAKRVDAAVKKADSAAFVTQGRSLSLKYRKVSDRGGPRAAVIDHTQEGQKCQTI